MEKDASRSKVPLGVRIPVPPPKPLPLEDVPMWTTLPYDTKYPHAESDVTLSRQELGKRLHQTYPGKEFDLTRCLPAEDSVYNSLHDPHLRNYFQSGQRYGSLVRTGLVTRDGHVKSRLQEFNQYRMYLYHLWAMQVNQTSRIQMSEERNRLEGLLEAHDSEDPLFNDFAKKYERIKVEEILEEVATEIFQNKSIIAEHGFSPFVRSVIQWKLYQEQLQKNFRGNYPAVKQWLCDQTRHYKQIMERKLNVRMNKEKKLRSRWEQICEVSRSRLDKEERRREEENQNRKRLSEKRLRRAKSIWDRNQREIRSRTQRNCKSLSDLFTPNRYITEESDDFLDVTRSEGTIGRRPDSPSSACYETESFSYSSSSSSEDNLPQISEEGIPARKAQTLTIDGEISNIARGVRESLTVPKAKTRSIQSRRKGAERESPRHKALGRKKYEVGKIRVADSSESSGTDDFSDAPEKRDSWEESNVLTMTKQTTSKEIKHRGKAISTDEDEISDDRGIVLEEKALVRKKRDVENIRVEYSSPSRSWTGEFSDTPEKRASSEESSVLTIATQTPSKTSKLRGKAISADDQEISDENGIIAGGKVLHMKKSDVEKIRVEHSSPSQSSWTSEFSEAPEKRLSLTELDVLTATNKKIKHRGKTISADDDKISDEIRIILEDRAVDRKNSEVEKVKVVDSPSTSSRTGDFSDARQKRASSRKLNVLTVAKETTSKKIELRDKAISADEQEISDDNEIIPEDKVLDIKRSEVKKIRVEHSSPSQSSWTGDFSEAPEKRLSLTELDVLTAKNKKIKHRGKTISTDEDKISDEIRITFEDKAVGRKKSDVEKIRIADSSSSSSSTGDFSDAREERASSGKLDVLTAAKETTSKKAELRGKAIPADEQEISDENALIPEEKVLDIRRSDVEKIRVEHSSPSQSSWKGDFSEAPEKRLSLTELDVLTAKNKKIKHRGKTISADEDKISDEIRITFEDKAVGRKKSDVEKIRIADSSSSSSSTSDFSDAREERASSGKLDVLTAAKETTSKKAELRGKAIPADEQEISDENALIPEEKVLDIRRSDVEKIRVEHSSPSQSSWTEDFSEAPEKRLSLSELDVLTAAKQTTSKKIRHRGKVISADEGEISDEIKIIVADRTVDRKRAEVEKVSVVDSPSTSSRTGDFYDIPEKRASLGESDVLTAAKQTKSKKAKHRNKAISADEIKISEEKGIIPGDKAVDRKKSEVEKIRIADSSSSSSSTDDFSDVLEKRAISGKLDVLTAAKETTSKKIQHRDKAISADQQEISEEKGIIPGERVLEIKSSDVEKIRVEHSSPSRSWTCDFSEAPEKRLSVTELGVLTAAKQTTSKKMKHQGKAISADNDEISDEIRIILEDKAEVRKKSKVEKTRIADSSSSSSSTGDFSDAPYKRASSGKLNVLTAAEEATSKKIPHPGKSISADEDKISNGKGAISGYKALDIKRSEDEKIQVADSSSSSSTTDEFYDASERRGSSEEWVVSRGIKQTTSEKIKHRGKAISDDEDEISDKGEISQEDAMQPFSVRMIKADKMDYGGTAAEIACLERDGKVESLLLADSISFVEQTTIQLPLSFEDQSKLVQLLYGLPDISVVGRVEGDSTHLISGLVEREPKDQPESEPVPPSPGTDLWKILDSREYKRPDFIWKAIEKSLDESKRSRQEIFGLTDEKIIARSRETIFREFCGTKMGASLTPSSHYLGSRRESLKSIVERVKCLSDVKENVESDDKSDDGSELRASEDVTRLDLRSEEGMRKYIRRKQFLSKIDFPKAPLGKKARGVRKTADVRSLGHEKGSISRSSLASKERLKSECLKYPKEKLDVEFFDTNFAKKDIEKVGVCKILEDNKYKIASDSETLETKRTVYRESGKTDLKKTDSGTRSSRNEIEGAEISNILKGVKTEIASDAETAGSTVAVSGERERKWEEYDLEKTHSGTYLSETEEDEIYSIRKDTVNEIVSVSGRTSETKRIVEDEKKRPSIPSFVDNRDRKSRSDLEKYEFSNEKTTGTLPPLRQDSKRIREKIMKKKTITPTKPVGIEEEDLISASDVKQLDISKKSERITYFRPTEIIPYTQTTRPEEIFRGKQNSSVETNRTDIDSNATTASLKGSTQIKNGSKEYETLGYPDDIPKSIRHSKSFIATPPDLKQADFDRELEGYNSHFYQIQTDSNEFSVESLETADFIENWGPFYDLDEKDDTLDTVSSFINVRQEHVPKQRPEITKRWKSLRKPMLENIVLKKLASSTTNEKEGIDDSCGSTVKTDDKTSVFATTGENGKNLPAQSAVAASDSKQFEGASKRVNGNTQLQESTPFNDGYSQACAAPNLGNIDSIVLTAQPEISEDKVDKIVWEENASFSPVYSDFLQIEEIPAKTLKWIERDTEDTELSFLNLFDTLPGGSRLSPSKGNFATIESVTVSFEFFPLINSKSEDKNFQVLEDSSVAVEIVSEVEESKPIIDIRRDDNKNTIPFGPHRAPLPSSCSRSIIAWFEGCFGPVSKKESEEYLPKTVSEGDAEEYLPKSVSEGDAKEYISKSVSEGTNLKKHASDFELDRGFRKDFSSSEDVEGMGVLHYFDKNEPVCEQNNSTDAAGSSLGGFPVIRNLVADEYTTGKENTEKEDNESDDKSDDGSKLRASEDITRLDLRSKEGMRKNIHRKHISSNIGFPKASLGKIARGVCKTDDGKSLGDSKESISRSSLAAEENLKSEHLKYQHQKLDEQFVDVILLPRRRLSLEAQSVGTEPDATPTDFESNRDNVPQISTSVTDKELTALKQSSVEERSYRTPSPKDSFVVEPFSNATKLKKEEDSLWIISPVTSGSEEKYLKNKDAEMISDRGHDSMSPEYKQQIETDSEESDMVHKRRLLKDDGAEKIVGDDTADSPDTSIKQKNVDIDIETSLDEIFEDVQTFKIKKPKQMNDAKQIASESTVPKGKLTQKLAKDSESETNHAGRIAVKVGEKMSSEDSAVESESCEHETKPTMHFTDNDEQILPSFDTEDGDNVPNGERVLEECIQNLLEECIQKLENIHIQCPTSHDSKTQDISLDPDERDFHEGETKKYQNGKGILQETGRNNKGKQSLPPLRHGSKGIRGEITKNKDITPPKSLGIEEKDLITASDVKFLDASAESEQIENFQPTEMISYMQPTTIQDGIYTDKKHSSEETNRTDIDSNATTASLKGSTQIKNESKEGDESLAYPNYILTSIRDSESFTATSPNQKQADFDRELERSNLPFYQIQTDPNEVSVKPLERAAFKENLGPFFDLDQKDDTLDAVSSFITARQDHVPKKRSEIVKRCMSLLKPNPTNIVVKNLASSETNVKEGKDGSCGSTVKTDDKTSVTATTGEQGSNPPVQSAVAAAGYTTGSENAGRLNSRDRKSSAKDINRGARAKTKSKRIVPMVPSGKLTENRSGRDFVKSTDIVIGEEEAPVSTEYTQYLWMPTAGPSRRTSAHSLFETDVGDKKRFQGVRDDRNSPLEEGLDFPSRVYKADDGYEVSPSNVQCVVQRNNADVKRIADEKIQRLEEYFIESVVNVEEPVTSDDSQSDIRFISEKLSKLNL